jgi:SAM-dependent methyltransferase
MWDTEFGDAYTARNRVDWKARIPFWEDVLDRTGAKSAIEFGCNAGWNLRALREADRGMSLTGLDVNGTALVEARGAGLVALYADMMDPGFGAHPRDLAFTAGVLIHMPPDRLETAMRNVAGASHTWVLAVEYAAETEEMVPYRGHDDALWRRPFGKLYEEMGLELVDTFPAPGFDDCTAWLLKWT